MLFATAWAAPPGTRVNPGYAEIYHGAGVAEFKVAQVFVANGPAIVKMGPGGGDSTSSVLSGSSVVAKGSAIQIENHSPNAASGAAIVEVPDLPFDSMVPWTVDAGTNWVVQNGGPVLTAFIFVATGTVVLRFSPGFGAPSHAVQEGQSLVMRASHMRIDYLGGGTAQGVVLIYR